MLTNHSMGRRSAASEFNRYVISIRTQYKFEDSQYYNVLLRQVCENMGHFRYLKEILVFFSTGLAFPVDQPYFISRVIDYEWGD